MIDANEIFDRVSFVDENGETIAIHPIEWDRVNGRHANATGIKMKIRRSGYLAAMRLHRKDSDEYVEVPVGENGEFRLVVSGTRDVKKGMEFEILPYHIKMKFPEDDDAAHDRGAEDSDSSDLRD